MPKTIVTDLDFSNFIDYGDENEEDPSITVDEDAIREDMNALLANHVGDYNVSLLTKLNIQITDITKEIDINDAVDAYFSGLEHEPDYSGGYGGIQDNYGDAIDDLFERS